MTVMDDLISAAHLAGPDLPIQQALVGLYWTVVTSRQTGLAATQPPAYRSAIGEPAGAGNLETLSAYALMDYFRSPHPLEAGLGLAALNSFLPAQGLDPQPVNARELLLHAGQGKKVALVGHFAFTEALRAVARRLWVLELDPDPGDEPAECAPELLPQADVIGLTAMTLSNHTFDDLATLFPPHALVVMIGPSTPVSPVLFDYGVDVLAGSLVTDSALIARQASQGSPLHQSKGLRRFTRSRGKP